jgi:hypothetical protein
LLSKTEIKMIANQFSRSKVIDCVVQLLTMRWNAWQSERHRAFTAGGERVKDLRVAGSQATIEHRTVSFCHFFHRMMPDSEK